MDEASEAEDDGTKTLLVIRDALQLLQHQLVSFQALQQQHEYQREAALSEIDHSRNILLKKLREYRGEDLEVIHETTAFASEKVEHNDDLLLPPYPSRSHPFVLDNGYPSQIPPCKYAQNGVISCEPINKVNKYPIELERNQNQTGIRNSLARLRSVVNVVAKTALVLVSVISVLNLAGFELTLGKRDAHVKVLDLFQKSATSGKSAMTRCSPGKVLVMEDGELRCLVKERVEIPFEAFVTKPDASYGCG
ncbi:hypothetical protein L1049_024956 [Liquidambar formosana]|uniref:Plastid division protein PDV2 n=1 Tax=Liquidambar formosana TaxID=63359 RepID=A0AAP0RVW7_LIQFO